MWYRWGIENAVDIGEMKEKMTYLGEILGSRVGFREVKPIQPDVIPAGAAEDIEVAFDTVINSGGSTVIGNRNPPQRSEDVTSVAANTIKNDGKVYQEVAMIGLIGEED